MNGTLNTGRGMAVVKTPDQLPIPSSVSKAAITPIISHDAKQDVAIHKANEPVAPRDRFAKIDAAIEAAVKDRPADVESDIELRWSAKSTELLNRAFNIFHEIYDNDDAHAHVLKHPALQERLRGVPRTKRAHLAMVIAMNARSEDKRKTASRYANVLLYAKQKDVLPDRFAEWVEKIKLTDAVAAVRASKKDPDGPPRMAEQKPFLLIRDAIAMRNKDENVSVILMNAEAELKKLLSLTSQNLIPASGGDGDLDNASITNEVR